MALRSTTCLPFMFSLLGMLPATSLPICRAQDHISRAYAYDERQEFDKAIAEYSAAIRLDPRSVDAFYGRGTLLAGQGDTKNGLADLSEAIRLAPKFAYAFQNRGNVYLLRVEDFDAAIRDYTEAIRINPKEGIVFNNRGLAWEQKGEFNKALKDFEECILRNPNFAISYNRSSWILSTCYDSSVRDGTKAVKYATRACELTDWKDGTYIRTLAAAYAELGDYSNAISHVMKAKELGTKDNVSLEQRMLDAFSTGRPYRNYLTHPLVQRLGQPASIRPIGPLASQIIEDARSTPSR